MKLSTANINKNKIGGPMAATTPGAGHMREREARLAQAMREHSSGWAQTRE